MKLRAYIFLPLLIVSLSANVYATSIVLDSGSSWGSSIHAAEREAAFQRAANSWGSLFSDPITINIKVNFSSSLPDGVLGSTDTPYYGDYYDRMLSFLVSDAADEGASNAIVNSAPNDAEITVSMPTDWDWWYVADAESGAPSKLMLSTSANLKAMGYTEAELTADGYTGIDALITFRENYAYDYDNSNGVSPGIHDFESTAAHEIGHVLGFNSNVDYVDWVNYCSGLNPDPDICDKYDPNTFSKVLSLTPLDLFRFNSAEVPFADTAEFTSADRNMVPGASAVFYDMDNEWAMSWGRLTPVTQRYQASHWTHADPVIGMMEPALGSGITRSIYNSDIRALDLIGWDLAAIPEPATLALMSTGLIAVMIAARRKKNRRKP
jgi:hypothetical protein